MKAQHKKNNTNVDATHALRLLKIERDVILKAELSDETKLAMLKLAALEATASLVE